jgi:hypothetical protein
LDAVETPLKRMKKSQNARHRLFFAVSPKEVTINLETVFLTSVGGGK